MTDKLSPTSNYLPGTYEAVFNLLLWILCMFYHQTWQLGCTHAKCLHVHMLPCRVNSYFVHSIMFINNIIVGQTHTTALHSRFANYAPNTRVLTSQGSWIEIENIIHTFLLPMRTQNLGLHPDHQLIRCEGCSEMSVCFLLATQLPEMHPFSDIQY